MGKVPVFTLQFLRYAIAGAALYYMLKRKGSRKIEPQDYKYVFFVGFLGYFLSNGAQFMGTKLSNASLASLVNSMNPITITLFGALILKEKLSMKKVICTLLVLTGVFVIMGDVNGSGQVWGVLLSIFSVILWSFASVTVRRLTRKYDSFQITVYGILIGALCALPVSTYELVTTPDIRFDGSVVLSLFYMGLVCTALAHALWNRSLSMIEAGNCSLFYPVQPMVAVFLGWLLLGESISPYFILGAVLIVGGVVLSIVDFNSIYRLRNRGM